MRFALGASPKDDQYGALVMVNEAIFTRQINTNPVKAPPGLVPSRTALNGSAVRLEPLDPARHGEALFRAGHATEAALRSWEYLPWGPFATEEACCDQLRKFAAALDLVYYAVCDPVTEEAVGKATYLDIQPSSGVIEIGGIWFAPAFQRTRAATEALFLMLAHAMDDLGYRRMQWRCNAQNAKSRAAATRLGFRFEGIWFNHMITKGLNRDTAWYSILDTEWPAIRAAIQAWLEPANFNATGGQRHSLAAMTASLR
jgi:RimJ/RimL family protein N-acetyltransferase